MSTKVFIFAGTTEGRLLYYKALETGLDAAVFVATHEGRETVLGKCPGELVIPETGIRLGRLDSDKMVELFRNEKPDIVFDATHPFAIEVTKNIRTAAAGCGIPCVRVLRESEEGSDESATYVASMDEALELTAGKYKNKNVLFTTGSKEAYRIREFFEPEYVSRFFFFRILPGKENRQHIADIGGNESHVIEGMGPFSQADNVSLIKEYDIDVLITKESGKGSGFEDKLKACSESGTDAIVIRRPKEEGVSFDKACRIIGELQ